MKRIFLLGAILLATSVAIGDVIASFSHGTGGLLFNSPRPRFNVGVTFYPESLWMDGVGLSLINNGDTGSASLTVDASHPKFNAICAILTDGNNGFIDIYGSAGLGGIAPMQNRSESSLIGRSPASLNGIDLDGYCIEKIYCSASASGSQISGSGYYRGYLGMVVSIHGHVIPEPMTVLYILATLVLFVIRRNICSNSKHGLGQLYIFFSKLFSRVSYAPARCAGLQDRWDS